MKLMISKNVLLILAVLSILSVAAMFNGCGASSTGNRVSSGATGPNGSVQAQILGTSS